MNKIKEFFNEYGKIVSKILLNHIAMTVFGIIVSIATKRNTFLFYAGGVLAILMYMFLLYMIMWELGSKDKVRVDSGRIKRDRLIGLKISLVANSVFIVIALVIFILSFFVGKSEGLDSVYSAFKLIMHYTNGMYLTVTSSVQNFEAGINFDPIYLIIIIPSILCCAFSYLAGLSGMKCIFPDKKENKKK